MSVDKLVDSTQLDADLTSVANAIRTKGGTSASLAFPADFLTAIAAIPTGGGSSVESGSFTPATNSSHTFEMGSLKHLAFLAETSPYGSGFRTMAAGIIDIDNNSAAVRSSSNGSSAAGWYGARFYTLSGTDVIIGADGTIFYFIAGITYDWWAW